jgi:hypothetical protein
VLLSQVHRLRAQAAGALWTWAPGLSTLRLCSISPPTSQAPAGLPASFVAGSSTHECGHLSPSSVSLSLRLRSRHTCLLQFVQPCQERPAPHYEQTAAPCQHACAYAQASAPHLCLLLCSVKSLRVTRKLHPCRGSRELRTPCSSGARLRRDSRASRDLAEDQFYRLFQNPARLLTFRHTNPRPGALPLVLSFPCTAVCSRLRWLLVTCLRY